MCDFPKRFGIVPALVLLTSALLTGCETTSNQEVMFQAMVDKPGDRLEVQREQGAIRFLVTSPSGIGTASLTRWRGDWPADVRIRLRYAGDRPFKKVEGFTCAVGSKRPVEVKAIRYAPDYAEVQLPPEALRARPATMHLQWVDYYR